LIFLRVTDRGLLPVILCVHMDHTVLETKKYFFEARRAARNPSRIGLWFRY
jgi:hypothetical protein